MICRITDSGPDEPELNWDESRDERYEEEIHEIMIDSNRSIMDPIEILKTIYRVKKC